MSISPSSSITNVSRYTAAGKDEHKMEVGSAMSLTFTLHGQAFYAINGPPASHFNPAVSFTITCEDQEEVDYYWEKLGDGEFRCVCFGKLGNVG